MLRGGSSLYSMRVVLVRYRGVLMSYRDHPRTIWERSYIIYRVGERGCREEGLTSRYSEAWWMEAILGAYPPCLLLKMRCA